VKSRVVLAGAVAAVFIAGCSASPPPAPRSVPTALAPATVLNGDLQLHLNETKETAAAFHQDDHRSLISDGKLWEVRRNDRLIGTLEIATVKPSVNLTRASVRTSLTTPILVGATSTLRLSGQEVSTVTRTDGVATLVWFGKGLLEIVQVKDQTVAGPQLAQAIIDYQQTRSEWSPLSQLFTPQ
jgi:hypothetical protein